MGLHLTVYFVAVRIKFTSKEQKLKHEISQERGRKALLVELPTDDISIVSLLEGEERTGPKEMGDEEATLCDTSNFKCIEGGL